MPLVELARANPGISLIEEKLEKVCIKSKYANWFGVNGEVIPLPK